MFLFSSGSLEDEHVLWLSKRITDGTELEDLAITGLGLDEDEYRAATYDHSDSIQAATHKLLRKWLQQQTDRQDAFKNIQAGLRRCERKQLAVILSRRVMGHSEEDASTSIFLVLGSFIYK